MLISDLLVYIITGEVVYLLAITANIDLGIITLLDTMAAEHRGVIFAKCTNVFSFLVKCCMDSNRKDYICHLLTQFDAFFLALGINPNADSKGRCFNVISKFYSISIACVVFASLLITIADFSLSCFCPALCMYYAISIMTLSHTLSFYLYWIFIVEKRNLCISSLAEALQGCTLRKQLCYVVFILKTLLLLIYLSLFAFLVKDMSIFLFSYILEESMVFPDMGPVLISFPPFVSVIRYISLSVTTTYYYSSFALFQIHLGLWCYLLLKAFRYCNRNIECVMARGNTITQETIENTRYRYEQCLTALSKVDNFFSLYIGLTLFSCLASVCIMIYIAVSDSSKTPHVYVGLMSTSILLIATIVPPLFVKNEVSALLLFQSEIMRLHA